MTTGLCRPRAVSGGLLAVSLALCIAEPAVAVTPEITPTFPTCVSAGDNAVVEVKLRPEGGWASVRLYFKANGSSDYYFLEMRALGNGKYFAVIPRPLSSTSGVDMYVEVRDGDWVGTKSVVKTESTSGGCSAKLNEEQKKLAGNLVVGETNDAQRGAQVFGFECEGIVSRIDVKGVLRPDELCRWVAIAGAVPTGILIPALAVGAGGAAVIITNKHEKKECSPCDVVTPP
jgi:hypothetical protein